MRIPRLLVCGALIGAVLTVPGVANASEKPGELFECLAKAAVDTGAVSTEDVGEVTLEELEEAAKGDSAGDLDEAAMNCYESPNPVIPAPAEILWGAAAFAIVLFGLIKFGFPMLKQGLAAREEKIRTDLEAAEAAKADAEQEAADYRAQLGDARGEAGQIIDEARQAADQVRRDLVARAEADAADIRAKAAEDARAATDRAMADVQAQVSNLSIELAERIVRQNLDRQAQLQLIENYINEVGGTRR
jgi:F-type H+-transporting ATPase subunit b